MFEKLFTNINDFIILGIFIYAACVLYGKVNVKTKKVETTQKIEALKKKKSSFIIVWAGIVLFSVNILKQLF